MNALAPPARDARLDALRGWLQVTIFISHISGSVAAAWMIHPAWGLSDSSEQFVFLSGFGLGSVFLWKQARQGFAQACRDLATRMARLWRMHMLVFIGFGLMVALASTRFDVEVWPHAMKRPWEALLGGAVLLYQPPFMGILPVFLMAMAVLPIFSWLAARHGARALWLPATMYVAAQFLPADWPGLGGTTLAFSPPAWVALFLLGAWFGRQALRHGRAVRFHPALLAAALAILVLGLWMRVTDTSPLVLTGKEQLAPLRLLHALALAWLVAALVPIGVGWARGRVGRVLGAIGRQSLPVFSLGLFLSYLASLALAEAPRAEAWLEPLLLAGGTLALAGFAARLDRRARPATAPSATMAGR
jgi:hypothetical protein